MSINDVTHLGGREDQPKGDVTPLVKWVTRGREVPRGVKKSQKISDIIYGHTLSNKLHIILLPILEFPDQANPKVESAKC